jgi:hypothetical protein
MAACAVLRGCCAAASKSAGLVWICLVEFEDRFQPLKMLAWPMMCVSSTRGWLNSVCDQQTQMVCCALTQLQDEVQ